MTVPSCGVVTEKRQQGKRVAHLGRQELIGRRDTFPDKGVSNFETHRGGNFGKGARARAPGQNEGILGSCLPSLLAPERRKGEERSAKILQRS